MIGEEEAALWRQAVESATALDVYLDWLLTHDPVRGELLAARRQRALSLPEQAREASAWVAVLELEGCASLVCAPLPSVVALAPAKLPRIEPLLERLPFLWVNLVLDQAELATAFASPVLTKVRRLMYTATRLEYENYQSDPTVQFGMWAVEALVASPHLTGLEGLRLDDEPGWGCAAQVARYPFVALRELTIRSYLGDAGILALAGSPLLHTLRRLELHETGIGDAGAHALARGQLEVLMVDGHGITVRGAAALRGTPSLRQLVLEPRVGLAMFASLEAFRAHCGEPTLALEACPLCRHLPEQFERRRASSMVADYDIDYGELRGHDHVPPQAALLETLFAKTADETFARFEPLGGALSEAVLRCPTCLRLYLHVESAEYVGAASFYAWTYRRVDAPALYRLRWGVAQRLSNPGLELGPDVFRDHQLVRFAKTEPWFVLDGRNGLVELDAARWTRLVADDPPTVDAQGALAYAAIVGEVDDPAVRRVWSIDGIPWRDPLTDEERARVEAMRQAIRIDSAVVEQVGGRPVVRWWVLSRRRLIYRSVTILATGDVLREDVVVADDLPVT